jgi:serine/threonine protein kinase
MEDLTGKQLGQYRIIAQIGQGGMATVYQAYQPSVDRYVALKILPRSYADEPDFVQRFKQEAKVIANLEHPNILPIYDYGEAEGYTYIVMRYIEGETLTSMLQGQPLPLDKISEIIAKIAAALDFAHSRGVIHRDVKPSNVLIDKQGHYLLTDFGLAKVLLSSSRFTTSGAFIGTPTYASPEQCLGREVDPRCDVYSLGVILYEMAVGRPPFDAETPMAIVVKHIHDPLPLPRDINPALPEAVERVILKALAKEPADRYQTAGELSRALGAALEHPLQVERTGSTVAPVESDSQIPPPYPVSEVRQAAPSPAEQAQISPSTLRTRANTRPWKWLIGCILIPLAFVAGGILLFGVLKFTNFQLPIILQANEPTILAPLSSSTPVFSPSLTPIPLSPTSVTLSSSPTIPAATPTPPYTATLPSSSHLWQTWTIQTSFPAPGAGPTGIVRVGDSLWVAVPCDNLFYQMDLQGNILSELEMPEPGCGPRVVGLAWDGTSLWGAWWSKIVQVDPINGQSLAEFQVNFSVQSLAWDGSLLWAADQDGNLSSYDASGQRQRRLAVPLFGSLHSIVWVEGELWVASTFAEMSRYGTNFAKVGSFNLQDCGTTSMMSSAIGTYWDGSSLWVADSDNNRITQCVPSD